ncbi:acyltransferase domain-containing protein [Agrobacterium vitis]|uniref:Acyltransferase domain-containing protein n=1 Tax=Agrobacterium vitis TaxID=373 RepID=A0AAE4WHY2_AGRVI|nr:type I polyketide synthase [Agrobacterium vitis]MCF1500986.1 acyltransferase domain-containing protein [Allorhizobium sp. Av2]MCM2442444.1 acyltransferase domain-containing protein [Agrobacterium vitis]MUZ60228.1 acyltransferase domain-containing protein [Agrobacterium vitis]MVA67671.1 acyltransferase domain-containing protein [Agrobacterium vitis]MVA89876.1 acyltransferase domain-containing protein [Agrobacterium vitis]
MNDLSAAPLSDDNRHQIAVIGMAGRFPGAPDVERFWQNLVDGAESIERLSPEALKQRGVSAEMAALADFVAASTPLLGADRFDAGFFGYSPAEAEILDPQQRIFLECAWQALEAAGYVGDRYQGPIGVFAAAGINTYVFNLHDNSRIRETVSPYELFVGNDKDFLATRTAFKLNLRGPAITVQTACSSSLVAVHMAAQSLLSGDCDMALAGGIALSQSSGYRAREGGILSPDGHCRAFDAASSGTVPGSGVGIVVLKRLEDALADGDTIDAVILGSAINNDGALKASFTAPQVDSQAAVIADAQAMAGVRADTIGYIEAHGTGTRLGDPIEVAALTKAFRRDTQRQGFCALGSVKTNIGHLDTAAGIAGFIKAVLALKNRRIPASLHYEKANPQIDFAASPFFVNQHLRDWDNQIGTRRAGVSSFGIGGTNAHVVLEEAPPSPASKAGSGPELLLLSARTDEQLAASSEALAAHLTAGLDCKAAPALADIAHTLRHGRRDFAKRRFVIARDAKEAVSNLRNLSQIGTAAGETAQAVFLFPGQGSPYTAMGKALYADLPAFRTPFDACASELDRLMGINFKACLFSNADDLDRTAFAQPALFAVEYALAQALMSHGVKPAALHGHSIGEYVAACLAGIFDLETALQLVVARGRLMQAEAPGAMLAVMHADEPISPWLDGVITLAAANAPGVSVVSGPVEAIASLEVRLKEKGIAARLLKTSHAFHSPMMTEAAAQFRDVVAGVRLSAPQMPLISNVTGTWMTAQDATDPDYWARHLLQPVRFEDGTRTLQSLAAPVFIEIGPGRALGTLTAVAGVDGNRIVATLAEGKDESGQVLSAVGQFWQLNGVLDSAEVAGRRRVRLPTYPFQSERYWVDADSEPATPKRTAANVEGPGLYRTNWRRAQLNHSPNRLKGRVLVFDDGQLGSTLATELERSGAEPYRALIGTGFSEPDFRCFSLRPTMSEDYASLFDSLDERGASPDHIVFGWPLTPCSNEAPEAAAQALLALVRELAKFDRAVTLTLLTRSAADVTGLEDLDIAQALAAGTLQVIAQEYPSLHCRHIDIDAARPIESARRIREALSGKDDVLALRGAHRWLPETERFEAPQGGPDFKRNGVYVVVGDIVDGVGKTWVDALSGLGATVALLQDSTAPAFEYPARLKRQLDCGDAAALKGALDDVLAELGRIDGIFLSLPQSNHQSAALIGELAKAHWAYNIASKLRPVRALSEAVAKRKIGFCCVQSSLSTLIGGLGLGAYAATHHAIDRIVAEENKNGTTPWFAIGYPLIEANPGTTLQATGRANAFAISTKAAWDLTRCLIENGATGQTMLSGGAIPPVASDIDAQEPADGGRGRPTLSVAYRKPGNDTEARIIGIFEEILGLSPIGADDGFYELGGHSLLAIRAVAKLREAFPVDIAMRELLFDNPTAAAIAKSILERMSEKTDLSALADLLDEVDTLSDADVSRLLAGGNAR